MNLMDFINSFLFPLEHDLGFHDHRDHGYRDVKVKLILSYFPLVSVGNGLLTDRYFTATFQVKSGVGFGYFTQCRVNRDAFHGHGEVHEIQRDVLAGIRRDADFTGDRTFGNKRVAVSVGFEHGLHVVGQDDRGLALVQAG